MMCKNGTCRNGSHEGGNEIKEGGVMVIRMHITHV